jgi:hypothetical protein
MSGGRTSRAKCLGAKCLFIIEIVSTSMSQFLIATFKVCWILQFEHSNQHIIHASIQVGCKEPTSLPSLDTWVRFCSQHSEAGTVSVAVF